MRAPEFWQRGGLASALLTPCALLYGAGGMLRERLSGPKPPPRAEVKVGPM